MEGNVIGRPSFCGAAQISIGDLAPEPTSEVGTATGPVTWRSNKRHQFFFFNGIVQVFMGCFFLNMFDLKNFEDDLKYLKHGNFLTQQR